MIENEDNDRQHQQRGDGFCKEAYSEHQQGRVWYKAWPDYKIIWQCNRSTQNLPRCVLDTWYAYQVADHSSTLLKSRTVWLVVRLDKGV